jgi:hypothetical protein
MLGDFNECMWQKEHYSIRKRSEKQMQQFREAPSFCDLHDLGFCGKPWTFDNNKQGLRNVRVCLDRDVANLEWMNMFPNSRVEHLVSPRSNHCPILLSFNHTISTGPVTYCRRYEVYWERETSLGEEIEAAWNGHTKASDMADIGVKLESVMDCLQSWSKHTIGSVPRKIEKLRKRLDLVSNYQDDYNRKEKERISKEMDEMLAKEEVMWKQRSCIDWLKSGDQNKSFFHRKATWRAKKNNIKKLQTNDGSLTEDGDELKDITSVFFKDLYTKDEAVNPEDILQLFQPKVYGLMNNRLCKEFSSEEISDALFQIGPMKAPGPDGYPARFFQKNWDLLKDEIILAVKDFSKLALCLQV